MTQQTFACANLLQICCGLVVYVADLLRGNWRNGFWLLLCLQLSVQENAGLTVKLNQTNRFSGVNQIKIIYGESECIKLQHILSEILTQNFFYSVSQTMQTNHDMRFKLWDLLNMFSNNSNKSDPELYRFKVYAFFETQCRIKLQRHFIYM